MLAPDRARLRGLRPVSRCMSEGNYTAHMNIDRAFFMHCTNTVPLHLSHEELKACASSLALVNILWFKTGLEKLLDTLQS